jgi:putative colanic acid biosynthesis acetyltransferase WcaF
MPQPPNLQRTPIGPDPLIQSIDPPIGPWDEQPWFDLRRYDQSGFDRGRPGWLILVWWLVQSILFPLTPHFLNGARAALLRRFGATIGKGVVIRPTARVTYPWKLQVGDYSWIGDDVVIYSLDRVRLGDHCVVSQHCYLCTGSHDRHDPAFGLETAPIAIGHGTWLAADCFVGPGVTIGANTIVGARSSVFKDLPGRMVCFGNPCQARYGREPI